MNDIPRPAAEPYVAGDRVRIYIRIDDADARFQGSVCEIIAAFADSLDVEAGRSTDAYSYTLLDVETGEELPPLFRHRDLVPVEEE